MKSRWNTQNGSLLYILKCDAQSTISHRYTFHYLRFNFIRSFQINCYRRCNDEATPHSNVNNNNDDKGPLRVLFLSDETGGGHGASAEASGKQVCFSFLVWYGWTLFGKQVCFSFFVWYGWTLFWFSVSPSHHQRHLILLVSLTFLTRRPSSQMFPLSYSNSPCCTIAHRFANSYLLRGANHCWASCTNCRARCFCRSSRKIQRLGHWTKDGSFQQDRRREDDFCFDCWRRPCRFRCYRWSCAHQPSWS